jgi:hypothetical protein
MQELHKLINAMILLDNVVSGSSSDVSPVAGGLMYLPSEPFRAVDVALTAAPLQGVEHAHTRAPTESNYANLLDHLKIILRQHKVALRLLEQEKVSFLPLHSLEEEIAAAMNVLTVCSSETLPHLSQGRAGLIPAGSKLDEDDASLEYHAGSIGSCGSDSDYEQDDMEDMEWSRTIWNMLLMVLVLVEDVVEGDDSDGDGDGDDDDGDGDVGLVADHDQEDGVHGDGNEHGDPGDELEGDEQRLEQRTS